MWSKCCCPAVARELHAVGRQIWRNGLLVGASLDGSVEAAPAPSASGTGREGCRELLHWTPIAHFYAAVSRETRYADETGHGNDHLLHKRCMPTSGFPDTDTLGAARRPSWQRARRQMIMSGLQLHDRRESSRMSIASRTNGPGLDRGVAWVLTPCRSSKCCPRR